jgi:hypothetical protein
VPKIYLDYSDGRYYTRQLTDEEAAQHEAQDLDVAHVADDVWAAYCRDCERDGIWQALWRAISNEQWMRRRERELMPLEAAQREISQLTDDRDQARRMWKHYEHENCQLRAERRLLTATTAPVRHPQVDEFTCVFPQPGCDVLALPAPWRDRAAMILAEFDAEAATDGIVHQGCCCGHEHRKLDEETAQQLRTKGFLVEHDSEPEEVAP